MGLRFLMVFAQKKRFVFISVILATFGRSFSFFFFFLLFVNLPLSGRSSQFPFPPSCPVAEGGRGGTSEAGSSGAAATAMETLYRLPFAVLECPNIKLKRPSWVHMPSAMTVYALVVVSYFLITGGEAGPAVSGTPRLRSSSSSAPGGRATAAAADPLSGSKWGVKREPRSAPSVPAASGQFSLFAAVRQR